MLTVLLELVMDMLSSKQEFIIGIRVESVIWSRDEIENIIRNNDSRSYGTKK